MRASFAQTLAVPAGDDAEGGVAAGEAVDDLVHRAVPAGGDDHVQRVAGSLGGELARVAGALGVAQLDRRSGRAQWGGGRAQRPFRGRSAGAGVAHDHEGPGSHGRMLAPAPRARHRASRWSGRDGSVS